MTEFQEGDKIKLVGSRKGVVVRVESWGDIMATIGGIEWHFSSEEAKQSLVKRKDKKTAPVEPAIGSIVLDKEDEAFVRRPDGWHFIFTGNGSGPTSTWQWKKLNDSLGPVTVVVDREAE